MRTNDYTAIAQAIITHGHPISIGWYDDGNAESGPRGGSVRASENMPSSLCRFI